MSNEHNNGKGFLLGLLAGGLIGAAAALLYAPKSGKELRNDIKNKTDEYLNEAEKYLAEAKVKAKDLINEGKKRSEKLITDAKMKSDELLKDAERVFNDAKSKAGDAISTGKKTIEDESSKIKTAFRAGIDAYKETKSTT